jgi:hypothetical protein
LEPLLEITYPTALSELLLRISTFVYTIFLTRFSIAAFAVESQQHAGPVLKKTVDGIGPCHKPNKMVD